MVPERNRSSSDFARVIREAAPYLGHGHGACGHRGVCFALGFWLDGWVGTKPWLALLFGSLGVVIALAQFVRMASNLNKPRP